MCVACLKLRDYFAGKMGTPPGVQRAEGTNKFAKKSKSCSAVTFAGK